MEKVYEITLNRATWEQAKENLRRYSWTAEYHDGQVTVRTYSRTMARKLEALAVK